MQRRGRQHRRVILFLFRGRLIGDRGVDLLSRVIAAQDRRDGRPRERVVDALVRRERRAERRLGRIEQASAEIRFHNGDAHALFLAQAIQLCPLRIQAGQPFVIRGEQRIDVLDGGFHIQRRIDGKHDHVNNARFHRLFRDARVVGGEADMAYRAAFPQFIHVFDILRPDAALPVLLGVHVVDHSQVDIVGLHAAQQVLERRLHDLHIPRAYVLPVLMGRTDVTLHDPLDPAAFHALADDVSGFRIRHPAVDDVDPQFTRVADQVHGMRLVVTLQPFAAEADLAHQKPCLSQLSVIH